MAIETDTVTLPAYWASAIVNGDYSSFTLHDDGGDAETAACDSALEALADDGWRVVSTVEDSERFTWSFDLYGGTASGGDVCDYVVHRVRA